MSVMIGNTYSIDNTDNTDNVDNANIELILPFPPTINSYYAKTRGGNGVYISKKGRVFRDEVSRDFREQIGILPLNSSLSLPLSGRLFVEVTLFPPDKRRRDVDNYMKALLDALTICELWEDDSQIDQLFIYRGSVVKGGFLRLVVSDAGPVVLL